MKKVIVLLSVLALVCGVCFTASLSAVAETETPVVEQQVEEFSPSLNVEQENAAEAEDDFAEERASHDKIIVFDDGSEFRISCSEVYCFSDIE